jgi:RimJ/RimL family protein N-acetyltransferase
MPRIVLSGEPILDGPTTLRPWRDSDLEAIATACQDPEIARWTPVPVPYGLSDARAFLLQRYDAIHAGASAPFAIVATDSGVLLGSIALNRPAWRHARAEVGYWLAVEARGHGHASRALRQISGWGFETLGLQRIDLRAATDNLPSQRVADRAGFTREALLRSFNVGRSGRQDMFAYGLLSTDAGARPDSAS